MKILIINFGSETFKYRLFDFDDLKLLKEGVYVTSAMDKREKSSLFVSVVKNLDSNKDIKIIGHRYVHGGKVFDRPLQVGLKQLKQLKKLHNLAPLHNPNNYLGIELARKFFPDIPNYAVFDTAFYTGLPEFIKVYALDYKFYKKEGIQKYGFHGTSHEYATGVACKKTGIPFKKSKIISVHLGGGCSITAINKGKVMDTSMGYTPLEGLMMMSRCGDIDAGVVLKLITDYKLSSERVLNILNKESGVKGITGTSDFKKVIKKALSGDKKCKLAYDKFCYQVKKYIGAYWSVLGGVDMIVFTGAIGYYSRDTRTKILRGIPFISQAKIVKVPANEELFIAEQIKKTFKK